ncbi:MAG: putative tellurite resistance protein B-like protein [Saprospiraceae bacterium]
MIDNIRQFFSAKITDPSGNEQHQEHLAAASLMVEVMVIDRQISDEEVHTVKKILERQFDIQEDEIEQLLKLAKEEVSEATSLYQFTRLINDQFDQQKKNDLMGNLWRVAFADEVLDKHEEALIRRIADLIHVPHADFIKTKHIARK